MPGPKRKPARIHGPILVTRPTGKQFLRWITHDGAGGKMAHELRADAPEKEREAFLADIEQSFKGVEGASVEMAINTFKQRRLFDEQQNDGRSAEIKVDRLYSFFRSVLRHKVTGLTEGRIRELYLGKYDRDGHLVEHGAVNRPTRFKRAPAVATHQAELFAAKDMLGWMFRSGLLPRDPSEKVVPVGIKKGGASKPTLNRDQAVRALGVCEDLITRGDEGAAAVALSLVTGMREKEIRTLDVQGVDEGGEVVQVLRGKTHKSLRKLRIAQVGIGKVVSAALRSLGQGRRADQPVFAGQRQPRHAKGWLRLNANRICRLAKVPLVSAHGLRRTHLSLAEEEGTSSEQMLRSAGHSSRAVQHGSYLAPGAVEAGIAKRANAKLAGSSKRAAPSAIEWRKRGVKVGVK